MAPVDKAAAALPATKEEEEGKEGSKDDLESKYTKALEIVNELDGSYDEAIDLLTDVLEYRCGKYGELALECAPAFYHYGLALFNKARLENDVFGEPVQKAMVEKAIHQMKQQAEREQTNDKENKADADADEEGEDVGEDVQEEANANAAAQEDEEEEFEENDMELAWRNLETARLIYSKFDGHEKEIADVYAALAELSMEREDFETSVEDFKSAIEVLEKMEGASGSSSSVKRISAEYHYKLCLSLQLYGSQQNHSGNKTGASDILKDSMSYCKKSLEILEAELASLKASKDKEEAKCATEVKDLESIMEEMQLKVEELTDSINQSSNPSHPMGAPPKAALGASSSSFDKPKLQDGGNKRSLGVVGRGVNRVSLAPVDKKQKC
jgi:nuclear autoantigenic sperm protein